MTELQENFILDNHLMRYTNEEIANALNCEVSVVSDFIKEYGITRPPLKTPKIIEEVKNNVRGKKLIDISTWVFDRWLEGYSVNEISEVTTITIEKVDEIIDFRKKITKYKQKPLVASKEIMFDGI